VLLVPLFTASKKLHAALACGVALLFSSALAAWLSKDRRHYGMFLKRQATSFMEGSLAFLPRFDVPNTGNDPRCGAAVLAGLSIR